MELHKKATKIGTIQYPPVVTTGGYCVICLATSVME